MSIKLTSGKYIQSSALTNTSLGASGTNLGPTILSYSLWIRLSVYPTTNNSNNTLLFGPNGRPFSINIAQNTNDRFQFIWRSGNNNNTTYDVSSVLEGFNYHLASVYNNGTMKFYVNGVLVGTKDGSSLVNQVVGNLKDPSGFNLQIGDHTYSNLYGEIEIDDPTVWAGYELTATDVLNIRNRSSNPNSISNSNIVFGVTCTGTVGNTALIADSGLNNFGTDSSSSMATITGSPTYYSKLNYSPPVSTLYNHVSGSGKSVLFLFKDVSGNFSNIVTIEENPTISINGGIDIELSNPIWGLTGGNSHSLPYILYPIEEQINPEDTVTVSAPEGWCTTPAGLPGEWVDYELVNSSGDSVLPELSDSTKNMAIGWHVSSVFYYNSTPVYNNLAKHSSRWLNDNTFTRGVNGYVSSFNEGTTQLTAIVMRPDSSPTYPGPEPGLYTLKWDGSDLATLSYAATGTTVTERSRTITGTTDNVVVYNVTWNSNGGLNTYAGIQVNIFGPNISNIRIYPPNSTPNENQKFHPQLIKIMRGTNCVRVMDLVGTNASNIVEYEDFPQGPEFSYYNAAKVITLNVSSASNWTNNNFFPSNGTYIKIVTTSPHNLVTGQTVVFSDSATITFASGSLNPNNFPFMIYVIDATSFAFVASNTNSTVVGTQSIGGTVSCSIGTGTIPIEDAIELANTVNSNLWINIPHAASDDCVEAIAWAVANGLASGKKCYVEYSNECWNYTSSFTQTRYCYGMGNTDVNIVNAEANITYRQYMWYGKRCGEVHSLFEGVFTSSGRESDLVRVYGGQMSATTVAQKATDYAISLGYQVDAIAIAPYYDNGPVEPSLSSVYDTLSVDQLLDMSDAWAIGGDILNQVQDAYDALPDGAELVFYEGGPQSGLPLYNGGSIGTTNIVTRSRAWGRHPRQARVLNYYMQKYSDIGVTLYNIFATSGTNGTVDANNQHSANWPAYIRWNQKASIGDGSDGLYVNSTNFENSFEVGSVIGYAWNKYNEIQPGKKKTGIIQLGNGKIVIFNSRY